MTMERVSWWHVRTLIADWSGRSVTDSVPITHTFYELWGSRCLCRTVEPHSKFRFSSESPGYKSTTWNICKGKTHHSFWRSHTALPCGYTAIIFFNRCFFQKQPYKNWGKNYTQKRTTCNLNSFTYFSFGFKKKISTNNKLIVYNYFFFNEIRNPRPWCVHFGYMQVSQVKYISKRWYVKLCRINTGHVW